MLHIHFKVLIVATTCLSGAFALPGPLRLASTFSEITTELQHITLGNCSLKDVELPINDTKVNLPEPSPHLDLKYVVIGRGTQNYSCNFGESVHHPKKSSTPKATGAVATLFDASCIASQSSSLLHEFPAIMGHTTLGSLAFLAETLALSTKTSNLIIGEHYFNAAGDPFFDLRLSGSDTWIVSKKDASVNAPTRRSQPFGKEGSDVPWLKLDCKDCKGVKVSSIIS